MQNKKIIIPSIFAVVLLTLFVIFGSSPERNKGGFEARQIKTGK